MVFNGSGAFVLPGGQYLHREHVRKEVEWFRGREIAMSEGTRDRPLAIFDGPARGIRCALAISEYASRLGIQMRVGLHTGECEMVGTPGDTKVCGVAPHIGAQVATAASPGEILVSSTVKDLVAGSGIRFEDKGTHALAEVSGDWRLFAVERGSQNRLR